MTPQFKVFDSPKFGQIVMILNYHSGGKPQVQYLRMEDGELVHNMTRFEIGADRFAQNLFDRMTVDRAYRYSKKLKEPIGI
jgi:hypothetical protein